MKKTKLLPAIIALAAALFSLPALAQGTPTSGLYFGVGVGGSNATDACQAGQPCGGDATAYGIFAGWQFYRALSLEVAFRDLGTSQSAGANFDSGVADITVLGGIPIGPVFLFGRGGVYRGEVSSGPLHDSSVNWTFGGGIQIDLTHAFALRADWQRYRQMGATNIGFRSDIDVVMGSVVFKFR